MTKLAEKMEVFRKEIMEMYSLTNPKHVDFVQSEFYGRLVAEVFNGDTWYTVGQFENNKFVAIDGNQR